VGYVDRCGECHIPIPIRHFLFWVYCVVLLRLAVHETNQERRSMIDYENPDVLTLRKWLNEESTSPIDRVALARVLAMVAAEADLYANVAYSAGFVEGERAAIVAQSAPQAAQPVAPPSQFGGEELQALILANLTKPAQPAQKSAVDFLPHDDNLRFVQRVLESDAPKSDRDDAAQMVRDMRRSFFKAAQPVRADRQAFESWAVTFLGFNPTWRESGECELAWQAWQAAQPVLEPLTDTAIFNITDDHSALGDVTYADCIKFARAIERAHGIGSDV
jgi:hypothetical protein